MNNFFLSVLSAYLSVLCGSMIYAFNHKEHKVRHEGHKGLFQLPQQIVVKWILPREQIRFPP
jgi:hypothetical protein